MIIKGGKIMGGCGDGILGLGGLGGFGGCGGCGRGCDDDKRIAVITAVRAIAARGEGCFDGKFL
jgi:hypothetical protein